MTVAMWVVGALVLLCVLFIIPPLWNYTSWYPKVWSAKAFVDGRVAPNSRFYAAAGKQRTVIVMQESAASEFYFVGSTPKGERFVWRCDEHAFSFMPGLAYSNHIQFGRGCVAGNFGIADETGNVVSRPKHDWKPNLEVGSNSIAFTAEDGRRMRVQW